MYFIPLIVLTLFTIIEIQGKDKRHYFFYVAFLFLTIAICLRYGQGTDYFGYMNVFLKRDHGEIGYTILQELFETPHLPFELMVAVIALFQMLCIYRAIMKYSPYKLFSLLLVYPTIYLTYFFSAIRQGIVIAFFLGFMLEWIFTDKWLKYVVSCLVLATFHSSALVLLPLVFIKKINNKLFWCGLGIAAFGGILLLYIPAEWLSFIKIGAVQYHIQNIELSPLGLAERTVMFVLITYFYYKTRESIQVITKAQLEVLYRIYFVGYIVAVLFFPWQLLSSRMGAAMKAVELILIPIFACEEKQIRKYIVSFMTAYVLLMTTKNIQSYINQNNYEGYNVITYPYYSIWNKEEAKKVAPDMWEDMEMWIEMQELQQMKQQGD